MKSKISVVIPTYNEEKDIQACLESLQKQSLRPTEIIIVDDGSTDQTKEIVKKFKNVRLLEQTHQGPGNARNLGAKNAKGDILIFVDADMTFEVDYLKNLTEPLFKNLEIIGTTHDQEIATNTESIYSSLWGRVRVSPENAKNVTIFRAIRKNKFLELGGFEQKYGYADDQTLWYKYGIKPAIAPKTLCYHKNPNTLRGTYVQAKWIGASWKERFFLFKVPFIGHLTSIALFLLLPWAILVKTGIEKIRRTDPISKIFYFFTAKFFGYAVGILKAVYLKKVWR